MKNFQNIISAMSALASTISCDARCIYEDMVSIHPGIEAMSSEWSQKVYEGHNQDDIPETTYKPKTIPCKPNTKRFDMRDKAKAGSKSRIDRMCDKTKWISQSPFKTRKQKQDMDMRSSVTSCFVNNDSLVIMIENAFQKISHPLEMGLKKCTRIVLDILGQEIDFDKFVLNFIENEVGFLFEDARDKKWRNMSYLSYLENQIALNNEHMQMCIKENADLQKKLNKVRKEIEEF